MSTVPPLEVGPAIVVTSVAILLIVGLFTPLAGIAAAVIDAWIAFSYPESRLAHVGAAGLSLALAMIGPGAWSIDARLFGRKQIDLSDLSRQTPRKW